MAFEGMATPLGRRPGPGHRGVPPWWRWSMLAFLLVVVLGLGLMSGARFRPGPKAGGAVAVIERGDPGALAPDDGSLRGNPSTAPVPTARPPNRSASAEIESNSGVNVIRQNGEGPPAGVVIRVPESERSAGLTADPRVSERSQFGILPRIGEGGQLPRNVYARAFSPTGKPMIGIVMTGVGIGARGTADAIAKLPGEVTLAFAPYGRDLDTQVARARREGHEILLQVPMEPHDYPDSDPGPHTLRANAVARENIERLHWLMSRFSGYVGLTNFLGGKLMAEPGTYGSILEEISRRGLLFLDDGSGEPGRSLEIGKRVNLPVRVANRLYEASGAKPLEIMLQEVEEIARRDGRAIISIPALPVNIEKIAAWERDLAARGLVLAPISAIIAKPAR